MRDSPANTAEAETSDARVGQILDDFLVRRRRGEPVDEAELLAQYPEFADELRGHLDLLRDVQPPTDQIDALISQGRLKKSDDVRYPAELGAYKITGIIGRGGMGIVLRAYEESLKRTVALKIPRPELADNAAAMARFKHEAVAAAALRHPNIVTIYAVGEEDGVHFIAMEYVPGPSLAQVIRQRGADEAAELCPGRGTDEVPGPPADAAPDQNPKRQRGANVAAELCPGRGPDEVPGPPADAAPDQNPKRRRGADEAAGPRHDRPTGETPVPHSLDLSTETIRDIFRQLLAGLAAAHAAGLIHRDIKSSNILLEQGSGIGDQGSERRLAATPDGVHATQPANVNQRPSTTAPRSPLPAVKIADFGLARLLTAQTRMTATGSWLGTPEYMSPEQARGDEDIDHRTDLYSAGVVLYEMLTGRTPFRADTPTATIRKIIDEDPPDPRELDQHVDPNLASLALRLMAKEPEERFQSAQDVLAAFDREKLTGPARPTWTAALRVLLVLSVFTLLTAGGAWLIAKPRIPPQLLPEAASRTTEAPITDVDTDELTVWAQRGHGQRYERFYEFGPVGDHIELVHVAEIVRLYGDNTSAIAVGTAPTPDGYSLFLFNDDHSERWRMDLSDEHERWWPDGGPPTKWNCRRIVAVDIDGEPGDEIVVVAGDMHKYPCRITIIDPRTQEKLTTFWHMGGICGLSIAPDFFGPEHPAILAHAINNYLDGPGQPGYSEDRYTMYDKVYVVMILDPWNMEGMGPPRMKDIQWVEPLTPYAYAVLNLPGDGSKYTEAPGRSLQTPGDDDITRIRFVRRGAWVRPGASEGRALPQITGKTRGRRDALLGPKPQHRRCLWKRK
ncbi:MAG: serine/threonine protein kinase [Planctomycetes bacterium]|nr:serine/threonine protein kinase [Planctomycetota bacterium]